MPALAGADYNITSPKNKLYNCIGWAANDDQHWWQPGFPGGYYWPQGVATDMTVDSYEAAFRRIGYRPCESSDQEEGFDKIALYEKAGMPSHAARQLPDGRWTSKCGNLEDIDHATPDCVSGDDGYGTPVLYMRRRTLENRPTAQALNIRI